MIDWRDRIDVVEMVGIILSEELAISGTTRESNGSSSHFITPGNLLDKVY